MSVSRREPFFWVTVSCSLMIMAFILIPMIYMTTAPSLSDLLAAARDPEVLR